jgi:hypothetical protein
MVEVPELARYMDGFHTVRKESTLFESNKFFSVNEDLIYIKSEYNYANLPPERGCTSVHHQKRYSKNLRANIKLSLQNF